MSRSRPDPTPWRPTEIVVGGIGRAHGLDGAAYLEGHGGVVPLRPGTRVAVDGRPAVIADRRGTDQRPILRLNIASTREQIEALRGAKVSVPAAALPAVDEDEYFHVDLIGCAVHCGDRLVGTVSQVFPYPANDVLEVIGDAEQVLVPFAADVVLAVDVPGRRIELREGFFG
jgi:16S rRNA processing protein RimM